MPAVDKGIEARSAAASAGRSRRARRLSEPANGPARPMRGAADGRPRRSDDVLRRLLSLIFEGRLSPGARLPSERELSQRLSVSRTTLRDAMNRLEARGFVERRAKSGNYVCTALPPAVRDPIQEAVGAQVARLADVVAIRKVLELWAVEQAVQQRQPALLRAMEKRIAAMRAAMRFRTDEQFERYRGADLEFHQMLARMTCNPIYVHLIDFLHRLIRDSIAISRELVAGDYGQRNLRAHERIRAAIARQDAPGARQAMLDHFSLVEQRLGASRSQPAAPADSRPSRHGRAMPRRLEGGPHRSPPTSLSHS